MAATAGTASARFQQVGRAAQAGGKRGQAAVGVDPVVAHGIAVAAIPFHPPGGESAELVAVGAQVPRFGNQLDLREHGVLGDGGEKRRAPGVVTRAIAPQGRGEVETKTVHMHFLHPVPQAVEHQPQRRRAAGVQRVASAGDVHAEARILAQAVVGAVVQPFQTECGAEVVSFTCVVVDHVQNDFQSCSVQRLDHALELVHATIQGPGLRGGVAGFRRKKRDRVVAPVVGKSLVYQTLVVHEGLHR